MLTQDASHRHPNQRSITIPFYLAVSIVLLICAMLTAAALVLSATDRLEKSPRAVLNGWVANAGWKATKGVRIREALLKLPSRYAQSIGSEPDLPTLVFDIKFKHQETLRAKREVALQRGMLVQEEGDLVPAEEPPRPVRRMRLFRVRQGCVRRRRTPPPERRDRRPGRGKPVLEASPVADLASCHPPFDHSRAA